MNSNKTYDQFYHKLDWHCQSKILLSLSDLPDQPFMDWFENGYDVEEAWEEVVKNLANDDPSFNFLLEDFD